MTGYSIKYAYHAASPDGGERIVLATDRRLGAYSPGGARAERRRVREAGSRDADYEFTLIEIRLDAKGSGEGKDVAHHEGGRRQRGQDGRSGELRRDAGDPRTRDALAE